MNLKMKILLLSPENNIDDVVPMVDIFFTLGSRRTERHIGDKNERLERSCVADRALSTTGVLWR